MSKYLSTQKLGIYDINYLYSIYLLNDKKTLLNNFYYPSCNIPYKEVNIIKQKVKFDYKIKKTENGTLITLLTNKTKIKEFVIKDNLLKTYKIRYGKEKIKDNDLINVLLTNLFISHPDINYCFNPILYSALISLDFKYNLMDNINSLFPKYGSLNYYESFFNSNGSLFDMKLYMGNYFITILNDQTIFDNVLDFIKESLIKSNKVLLIGILYPILVNKKKTINASGISSLKKYIIKKYKIKTNYYYDYYDRSKFYPNSEFELAFFINMHNANINQELANKYNNYIEIIKNLSKELKNEKSIKF